MRPTLFKVASSIFIATLLLIGIVKTISVFRSRHESLQKLDYEVCGIEEDLGSHRLRRDKFVIAVVGDGVKDESMAKDRPYSSNYAQGWDLYEGIIRSSETSVYREISKYVDIVSIDDGGNETCAKLISEEIIKSPNVIAVIGHATSGTTKAAIKSYREANIPTIIPIATNPELTKSCSHCFRLPSNDDIQAKAIADFAVNILKGKRIYLVWDDSDSAREYSNYLQNAVMGLIGHQVKFRQPITFRPMRYDYLLNSISYNETDVLIFCGYGSMAREFLNGLRFEYIGKEHELNRPKILLTDGSKISEIKDVSKDFGFQAYLTFPSEKLTNKRKFINASPLEPPQGQETMKQEESYEIFGYDALNLVAKALQLSIEKGVVSRKSLIDALQSERFDQKGFVYSYQFRNGENINSRYFVYSLFSDSIVQAYDQKYLNDVFTSRTAEPIVSFVNEYSAGDEERKFHYLDAFVATMRTDDKSQALVTILRTGRESKDQTYARIDEVKDYLSTSHGLPPNRITFDVGPAVVTQTILSHVPSAIALPIVPDGFTRISGADRVRDKLK